MLCGFAALGFGAGCGDEDVAPLEYGATPAGVGQGGAQDSGRFRALIEQGQIPGPTTLDAVGFFNEHKFELPAPTCGADVCVHGSFGVQGNMIDGSNCSTLAIGFNTALSPDSFNRWPLNLAIAVDTSNSMRGQSLDAVKQGLLLMLEGLDDKDEVSLVTYADAAEHVFRSTPENDPDRRQLKQAIERLEAGGDTNFYDGLRTAGDTVLTYRDEAYQDRLIILSDGLPTKGIVGRSRIVNLGLSYARELVGVTTIGLGRNFDHELMRQLAEAGSGNFYFVEDRDALEEIFREEVDTFLVPLAEEISITYEGSPAYQFRAAYGTRMWEGSADRASIYIPSLFMASRQSVDDIDVGGGRRGGGGLILLELVPTTDEALLGATPPGAPVGEVTFRYRKPKTDEFVEQTISVVNPLAPGETPEEGEFTDPTVEKAFVTLNIFAGFRMATQRAASGASNAALNVLVPLAENVFDWLRERPDEDIQADYDLMMKLIDNIERTGAREGVGAPPNPWPQD